MSRISIFLSGGAIAATTASLWLGLAALAGSALLTPAFAANDITTSYGVWSRGDGEARVRIAPCGGSICATNVWIRDPGSSEKVGDVLEMKLSGEGASYKGTAYDKQRKLTVSFEMNIAQDRLTTRGCVLGGFVCKSATFSRMSA